MCASCVCGSLAASISWWNLPSSDGDASSGLMAKLAEAADEEGEADDDMDNDGDDDVRRLSSSADLPSRAPSQLYTALATVLTVPAAAVRESWIRVRRLFEWSV